MNTTDFTTTLLVDQTPAEVFNAINHVRGWWSEEIEGSTDTLNDEFTYQYEDVHRCKMKVTELIPDKKVVWLVLDNYFNFTTDKSEWKGTKIIFEISRNDKQTQIRFTHQGLVPEYECYEICRESWSNYINNSLRRLITTGKGKPNPKEGRNEFQEEMSVKMKKQDYQIALTVNATADEAFNCINRVSDWWTENLEGNTVQLNDEFTVRFEDVHYSRQRLVEFIPNQRVVWLVTDSNLSWLVDKHEWTNTKISFNISNKDNKTHVLFTHIGLVPEIECYTDCSNAWSQFIQQSLLSLINTGKGYPDKKKQKIVHKQHT